MMRPSLTLFFAPPKGGKSEQLYRVALLEALGERPVYLIDGERSEMQMLDQLERVLSLPDVAACAKLKNVGLADVLPYITMRASRLGSDLAETWLRTQPGSLIVLDAADLFRLYGHQPTLDMLVQHVITNQLRMVTALQTKRGIDLGVVCLNRTQAAGVSDDVSVQVVECPTS